MLHLLNASSALNIVSVSTKGGGVLAAAAAADAAVVVVARSEPDDLRVVDPDLARAAVTAVFALTDDGSRGCFHVLKVESTRLGDISGDQLVAAISAAAAARAG